jgi:hypothetical protein
MKLCHFQSQMDGTGNHHVKWNKPDWERWISYVPLTYEI